MIVNHANYMILSANANTPYWEHWEAQPYPQWAALTGIAHLPVAPGFSVEPHYHDCDEFWLLIEGDGEAWMDDRALFVHVEHRRVQPHGRHPSGPKFHGRALLGLVYPARASEAAWASPYLGGGAA